MPRGLRDTGGPLQAPLYRDVEDKLDIVDEASDDGWANARCPAHDDENPSLGVKEDTKTGELVVNCRAGCSREKIFLSLGADGSGSRPKTKSGKRKKTTRKSPSGGKLVDTYEYRSLEGVPLALKKRYEPTDAPKYFVWADPQDAEKRGLPGNLKEEDLPLYNADKVREQKSKKIFFVEGEKAADALEKAYNALSVCLPGGAGTKNIPPEQLEILRGRKIIIWPDNDPGGRSLMRTVVTALEGIATNTLIISPYVPPKGDAYNYVQAGHTKKDLTNLIKETPQEPSVVEILDGYEVTIPESGGLIKFRFENLEYAPHKVEADISVWHEQVSIPHRISLRQNLLSASSQEGFVRQLTKYFDEKDQTTWFRLVNNAYDLILDKNRNREADEWVMAPLPKVSNLYHIHPLVTEDGLTVLFGMGGSGKSYLTALLSLLTATGHELKIGNDVFVAHNPGGVIYVDYEASRARLHRRMKALARGLGIEARLLDQKDFPVYYVSGGGIPLRQQVPSLRKLFKEKRDGRLLIVDSVAQATDGELKDEGPVSAYSNAITRIGATASISIAHVTKDQGHDYPFGSVFWHNAPRLTWNVQRLNGEDDEMGLAVYNRKSNDDNLKAPLGLVFNFSGAVQDPDFTVTITAGDVKEMEEKSKKGMGRAEEVDALLDEKPCTKEEIAKEKGWDRTIVSRLFNAENNKGRWVPVNERENNGGRKAIVYGNAQ